MRIKVLHPDHKVLLQSDLNTYRVYSQSRLRRVELYVERLYGIKPAEKPVLAFLSRHPKSRPEDIGIYADELELLFPAAPIQGPEILFGRMSFLEAIVQKFHDLHRLVSEHVLSYLNIDGEYFPGPFPLILYPSWMSQLPSELKGIHAHEYTHHLQRLTLMTLRSFDYGRSAVISDICSEGLADFAQNLYSHHAVYDTEFPGDPKDKLIPSLMFDLAILAHGFLNLVLHPLHHTKLAIAVLARKIHTKDWFLKKLEKEDSLMWLALHPYKDGFYFIDALFKAGVPTEQIFSMVTSNLPELREVFYPSEYLQRMRLAQNTSHHP